MHPTLGWGHEVLLQSRDFDVHPFALNQIMSGCSSWIVNFEILGVLPLSVRQNLVKPASDDSEAALAQDIAILVCMTI